ncbi:P1 family peptidase [Sphingomonas daechungensis]|uniref:P1 family peptidase n=1 Tax=Sphingomonas daechungensis TaxID=1176646 RepID=UPI00378449C6
MRVLVAFLAIAVATQAEGRARDLGIPFEGTPGPLNAITDVPGVEVGQKTLIEGEGPLIVGKGPVRSGVTIVFPRGHGNLKPVYGGYFNLNGNGEMTGLAYMQDFGTISGPIGITSSNAIGHVYAGIQEWAVQHGGEAVYPVVAETWDGWQSDINGFHVRPATAKAALDAAKSGPVEEGVVGGGTGMHCFSFKGGIGTSSRAITAGAKSYSVGVLVQCNTGDRKVLRIAGVPVDRNLQNSWLPCYDPRQSRPDQTPKCGTGGRALPDSGSIIIVVATDAPLMPVQLNRVAKRAALGLARLGSYSGTSSGDLIVAFSTVPESVNGPDQKAPSPLTPIADTEVNAVFEATVQATEEAIVNALVAARTSTGADGYTMYALPHGELQAILKRFGRLEERKP